MAYTTTPWGRPMSKLRSWLKTKFQHKDLGWKEIGETFTRFALFRCRWFNVYLHYLDAPKWHPECHDHPWGFLSVILWRGYLERMNGKDRRKRPGMVLWRPAESLHNVITPYGSSWSLIVTGRKAREWGFKPCERMQMDSNLVS